MSSISSQLGLFALSYKHVEWVGWGIGYVTTWIDVPRALIQYTAVANVSEERYQKDCIEREF